MINPWTPVDVIVAVGDFLVSFWMFACQCLVAFAHG